MNVNVATHVGEVPPRVLDQLAAHGHPEVPTASVVAAQGVEYRGRYLTPLPIPAPSPMKKPGRKNEDGEGNEERERKRRRESRGRGERERERERDVRR